MVNTLKKAVKWYCGVVSRVYDCDNAESASKNSTLKEYCRYLSETNK